MKAAIGVVVLATVLLVAGCAPKEPSPVQESASEGLENGSFTAELNGFEIHYEVHGNGPLLMVLPNSWGLSIAGLRGIYSGLEKGLTLVYFDPRGMGASSDITEESDMGMEAVRADFQALRTHLGLEKVNATGWSNGAMNLVYLAAENPESIDSAIFLHGTASFMQDDMAALAEKYPDLMRKSAAFQVEIAKPELSEEEKTARLRALWLDEWFPRSFADREAAPELIDRVFGDAEFSWAHADYSQRENPDFDARDRLPLITARCLVIAGAHDMMPVEKGKEIAEGIAGAQLALFEQSGHYAPVEEPQAFEELVFAFLAVD